jgi:hypothetical protein
MNRATGDAHARMTDRLLMGTKPAPDGCACDDSLELQRRINAAVPFIIEAIRHLDEIPSTTFLADQAPDAATSALIKARKALSALESGDE